MEFCPSVDSLCSFLKAAMIASILGYTAVRLLGLTSLNCRDGSGYCQEATGGFGGGFEDLSWFTSVFSKVN